MYFQGFEKTQDSFFDSKIGYPVLFLPFIFGIIKHFSKNILS